MTCCVNQHERFPAIYYLDLIIEKKLYIYICKFYIAVKRGGSVFLYSLQKQNGICCSSKKAALMSPLDIHKSPAYNLTANSKVSA